MNEDLSAAETFFRGLPQPEQESARKVCTLLSQRQSLRSLPVFMFLAVAGTLWMADHYFSPITVLVVTLFTAVGCVVFYVRCIKHYTDTIWDIAQEEASHGGEEVKYVLFKLAEEEPHLVPSLSAFVRTFN